ncbi:hypothetical protein ACP4OV_027839 [Aristida adscensionis]
MASGGRGGGRGNQGKKKVDGPEEVLSEGSFGQRSMITLIPTSPLVTSQIFVTVFLTEPTTIPTPMRNGLSVDATFLVLCRCTMLPMSMLVDVSSAAPMSWDTMRLPSLNGLMLHPTVILWTTSCTSITRL